MRSPEGIAIGVDVATAEVRAVAVDMATGAALASARASLAPPVRSAGGKSEQRPDYADVTASLVAAVCRDLSGSSADVRAICVTGTSGTIVPCAEDGSPIGNARLYDDTSSLAVLSDRGVTNMSSLGRMVSLQADADTPVFLHTPDVVTWSLAGEPLPTDTSHALKAGADQELAVWPEAEMTALGLDVHAVPSLAYPGVIVGSVSDLMTQRLGLPSGVRIASGMTDGCTAQISSGAIHLGDTMAVLGTTLVMKAVSAISIRTHDGAVYSHRSPDGDYWAGGASNAGAGVLATEFAGRDLGALDAAAAAHGPSTVIRYPLSRAGERFPVADPDATGFSLGTPTDDVDAFRAVLEGVAFVERLGIETLTGLGIRPHRHSITGGASRSAIWNRIRATALAGSVNAATGYGVVHVPHANSAHGAALLATRGILGERLSDTVDRLVPSADPVLPEPAESAALNESYDRFRDHLMRSRPGASASTSTSTTGSHRSPP
jgi:xylulokinase